MIASFRLVGQEDALGQDIIAIHTNVTIVNLKEGNVVLHYEDRDPIPVPLASIRALVVAEGNDASEIITNE